MADFGSQALVSRALLEAFPSDPLVAEEDAGELRRAEAHELLAAVTRHVRAIDPSAHEKRVCDWIDRGTATTSGARFWTLDPIDGTKGFLRREQYAVALALVVDDVVSVAALACPNLAPTADAEARAGTVFVAVRGLGAFARPLFTTREVQERAIGVSPCKDSAHAKFCESVESAHSAQGDAARIAARLGITSDPVRMDSQAKYGVVARGEAELYLRLPTRADYREKIWDHAAGTLIVEEAGGRVSDIDGRPLDFTRGRELSDNRGVIVSNGPLHEPVLDAIRALAL